MTLLTEPTRIVLAKDSVAATDTNIREVSLLLHGDGTNGSTTITDSSLTPKTVTAVGNAQISTAIADPFGNSTGVIAFDGTGGYIQCPASAFNPLARDFTVEWWQKLATTNTTYGSVATNSNGGLRSSNGILQIFGGGVSNVAATAVPFSTDWQHIAITKTSSDVFLFLNGTRFSNNASNQQGVVSCDRFDIGRTNQSHPNSFSGYIDEFRVTLGIARYTANFTPPTAPFPDF
jgi:hypothetical protein